MRAAPARPALEVVEYTDPMCPWAWGSDPAFRRLRALLAGRANWRRVYGLLFTDEDDAPPDPAAETAWYARHVAGISRHTGAPHARSLARVAACSWPSSLVAKAAELQGEETAERVLRRLRESVFVLGEPADSLPLALSVVRGVPGLDPVRLASDAASDEVWERVRADAAETRRPLPEAWAEPGASPHPGTAKETPDGGHRYALPTLLLRSGDARRLVPGWRELGEYTAAAEELCPGVLDAAPAPPSPAAALSRYGSLTDPERRLLGEGAWPPPGAVQVTTGNGPVWLCPEEAPSHPAVARTVDGRAANRA
ncbi:DsbA family protein [Streptomyces albidoflavus]